MFISVATGLFSYKNGLRYTNDAVEARNYAIGSVYSTISEPNILKYQFLEVNSAFQLYIGKNTVEDPQPNYTVVRLKNNYLTFVYPEYNIDFYADDLISFNDELENKEIPMLYIQVPIKNDKFDNILPYGIEDYSNYNADKLLSQLKAGEVKTIDLRDVLHKNNSNISNEYFRTDHHWLPETAFKSYSYICELLNNDYGFNINKEYYQTESFRFSTVEDYVLGHIGNRVGCYYSGGTEDISIISPHFPTYYSFSRLVDEKGNYNPQSKTGAYENTILVDKNINQPNVYSRIGYHTYIGGDYGELRIENDTVKENKRILLIRDSFGAPFVSFLSTAVKNLDVVDLRYFGEDRTISEYVEQTKPDMVMFFMSPHMYEDSYTQALDFYSK